MLLRKHMPTILFVMGWRFFFYSNEKNEPVHIHCQKAEKECKYWLDPDNFDLDEAFSYNMNNIDKREVKRSYSSILSTLKPNGINFMKDLNNGKTTHN